jgi:predicted N-acetyltransferase YhbS
MKVECLEWQALSPEDALQIGELTFAIWGPKDKPDARPQPAGNYTGYCGSASRRPRRYVVRDGGRIVSHASVFAREIDVAGHRYIAAALGGVCTYEEYRGKGYAAEIVRAVLQQVDRGDFELCLFQTGIPAFYEKLGCRCISNRIINSLSDNPEKHPLWEEHMMVYPRSLAWPDGTLDLLGPCY